MYKMRVQDSLFYVLYYHLMKKEVNWIFHEMLLWAKKIYRVFHKHANKIANKIVILINFNKKDRLYHHGGAKGKWNRKYCMITSLMCYKLKLVQWMIEAPFSHSAEAEGQDWKIFGFWLNTKWKPNVDFKKNPS